MASYRFCRPDDIDLLIEAVNSCYTVHFSFDPEERALWNRDRFKKEMHEFDLWPGWCMIATHENRPISVLLTAKRENWARILKLATHPDHLRQGHASHLLNSLKQKLAILAPKTKMEAILPKERTDLLTFFQKQGYRITKSDSCTTLENEQT